MALAAVLGTAIATVLFWSVIVLFGAPLLEFVVDAM